MAISPSKRILVYPDGTYKIERFDLKLYQIGDDLKFLGEIRSCAYGGCPGVATLIDEADTVFDKYWQFYEIAINWGMSLNNISNLNGTAAALMNKTGSGNPDRRDWILGENLSAEKDCQLDKLRSFCLNTHYGHDDGTFAYLEHMNGNNPPLMKIDPSTGKPHPQPESIEEIVPDHYLMLPSNPIYRPYFLDCTNVKWKPDTQTLAYGSFAHGLLGEDGKLHSFFPFVSEKSEVKVPLTKLNIVDSFPSPFIN